MRKKKVNIGSRIFDIANYILLTSLALVCLYPCYYVVMASFSNPLLLYSDSSLLLWPKGFSWAGYEGVMRNSKIWLGYRNTCFYVLAGGFLSVFTTVCGAYGLTRTKLPFRNTIMMMILFSMYFGGGLIPTFLVVKAIGIWNTPLAMIIPGMISTYNLIVTMSYFRGIPGELDEAARIDGASDLMILFKIFVPLAKPVISVIALYYMVGLWNNYFRAMIYLKENELFPLQLILREILLASTSDSLSAGAGIDNSEMAAYADSIKYAVIVVSTVPVMCIYPFIQKYFTKGVMIGAVKG